MFSSGRLFRLVAVLSSRPRLALLVAAGASLSLSGCHSVHSLPANAAGGRGIPYHLPAGSATITLTFTEKTDGDTKRISPDFSPQTATYPDPTSTFYLRPDNNGFFGTHHTITVSNGLLTSVSTDETGQIKDAILALVDTGINLAKLKYGIAGLRAQGGALPVDIFLTDERYPTEGEIAYVLARAAGSSIAVNLRPESPPGAAGVTTPVAGAGPYLELHSTLVESSLQPVVPPVGAVLAPNPDPQGFGGIYTRSMRPYLAGAELRLNLDELRKLRLKSYTDDLANLKLAIAHADADAVADVQELARLDEELSANDAMLKKLRAQDADLIVELGRPEITGEARTSRETLRTSLEQSLTAARTAGDNLRSSRTAAQSRINAATEEAGHKALKVAKDQAMIEHYSNHDDTSYLPGHRFVLRILVALVALPDPNSIAAVEITRAPIGETTNTISLTDGVLTKYESNRPSSFNEIAKIPLEVTNKLVAAVAQIFQFRVDTNTHRLDAKTSDVDLQEKLLALDKRMQQLEKDKAANAAQSGSNSSAGSTSNGGSGTTSGGTTSGGGSSGSGSGSSTPSGSSAGQSSGTSSAASAGTATRPGEEGLSPDTGKAS